MFCEHVDAERSSRPSSPAWCSWPSQPITDGGNFGIFLGHTYRHRDRPEIVDHWPLELVAV
jgi:hypothetical protein